MHAGGKSPVPAAVRDDKFQCHITNQGSGPNNIFLTRHLVKDAAAPHTVLTVRQGRVKETYYKYTFEI